MLPRRQTDALSHKFSDNLGVNTPLTFGEYTRRLRRRKRWQLQDLAAVTGLSVSHLSRIENDNTLPNPDTVVKLATALDGELGQMLELADCLPREILERLIRSTDDQRETALPRSAGAPVGDPGFGRALVDDMDPTLRRILAQQYGLSQRDVDGLFTVLRRIAKMRPEQRETVLEFLAASTSRKLSEDTQ
jgi:transcriptional regulator with XRE-family HTH domain